jgi:hypothetical protein
MISKSTRRIFFVATLAAISCGALSADTIFTLSATLADSSTVSGALQVDTINGTLDAASLYVQDDPTDVFSNIFQQTALPGPAYFIFTTSAANPTSTFPSLLLLLPDSLVGYAGGPVYDINFTDANGVTTGFSSGSITLAPSGVPEPASIFTSLAGLAALGILTRKAVHLRD